MARQADILATLERILDHQAFRSSPQLTAFLEYVVREELAGRGDKIKAYSVAVDALGRPETFDPTADPVIRVVASRLRQALNRFYAEDDAELAVEIRLIKGSYRPIFRRPMAPEPSIAEPAEPPEKDAPELPASRIQRYHLVIGALAVLLLLAIGYMFWDIGTEYADAIAPIDGIITGGPGAEPGEPQDPPWSY